MSALRGRLVQVYRNSILVAAVKTKSLKINGTLIDITSDDDSGWRNSLDAAGQMEVSISVAGILVSDQLLKEALNTTGRQQTTSFSMNGGWIGSPDHLTISGTFTLTSFEIGAEHQGAATFTAEFQSAGTITLG